MDMSHLNQKHQSIIFLSLILLATSIGLQLNDYYDSIEPYTISYEYINIKDMIYEINDKQVMLDYEADVTEWHTLFIKKGMVVNEQ